MNRKVKFVAIFALVCLAVPVGAQFIGRSVTVAQLGSCNGTRQVGYVTDAQNATTLGAGGGSAHVWVSCLTGSWAIEEVAAVADLTGYVLDSEAAQVSITASGAGNDVTLVAADDVILTPGDDFRVTPTAGSVFINSVGATEDVSLVASDDVLLTPADALTVASGGAVGITTTTGAIGLTAGGTTQDITLTSVDDVILAATDDTTVAGDQLAVNTTTAVVDAGGGADEITVAAASTTFVGLVRITQAATPPIACGAGVEGGLYLDADTHLLCVCNATGWVQVADGTTGCS